MSAANDAEIALLSRAREIAEQVLAPRANEVDDSDHLPIENLRALAEAGLYALAVPAEHGGADVPARVSRRYHGILAEACGTTTFVAIQHASACSLIAKSPSESLRARVLPRMAPGELMGAPAFSHIRRPGPPAVRVVEDGDDFVFDGVAPWVTGWGAIGILALAGTLPDGRYLFAAVSLGDTECMQATPLRLAAMNASGTVSLALTGVRVPRDHLLFVQTPEERRAADRAAILNQAPCSLGVAAAATTLLEARVDHDAALAFYARSLRADIATCWRDLETWGDRPEAPAFHENALDVRAGAVDLGVRAAFAAIVATGGSSLKRDRDAQRLHREAALYAVAPQTTSLRHATLARLFDRYR